jgi:hypothetical protein
MTVYYGELARRSKQRTHIVLSNELLAEFVATLSRRLNGDNSRRQQNENDGHLRQAGGAP